MIVQDAILVHWFSGRGLALTLGLRLAVSRLASYMAMVTVYPITEWSGFYGTAFWVATALCTLSFIANLVYVQLLRIVARDDQLKRESRKLAEKRRFRPSGILAFPAACWCILLIRFLLASNWSTFLHINTELVKERFGRADADAAQIASVAQVLPIFIAPFLGYLFDRYGRRCSTLAVSSILFAAAGALLLNASISPVFAMLVYSASLTIGPMALVSSVPLLLPFRYVGTGLGMCKSAMDTGVVIFDILVGRMQDTQLGYDAVLCMYIVVGLVVALFVLIGLRRTWGARVMEADAARQADLAEWARMRRESSRRHAWAYAPLCALFLAIMTSWAFYWTHFF